MIQEEILPIVAHYEFTTEPEVVDSENPNVWEALGPLTNQAGLPGLIESVGEENIHFLVIPSLAADYFSKADDLGVDRDLTATAKAQLQKVLGVSEKANISAVTHGGASIVRGLLEAKKIVANNPNQVVVLLGAELLSKIKGKDMINAAGLSVNPPEIIGKTLHPDIPVSLITSYALGESAVLTDKFLASLSTELRKRIYALMGWSEDKKNKPYSGRIVGKKIAGSHDGAFCAIIRTQNKNDNNPIYLADGVAGPR